MRIPLAEPEITSADVEAVAAVLRSGRLSLGPRLAEFERRSAAWLGAPFAVGVNSGTSGLHLCLIGLGIGAGDEVITPSFSFVASGSAMLYVGANPVFVDVDPESLTLDPEQVEAAITPRTRAILAVHVFGRPAPMRALCDIAARHGLRVIEDACEAFGAEVDGRKAGTWGEAGVFAFYPNKQITAGEGGLVVTRDAALADHLARLRNQGRDPSSDWYEHVELGYSYRLSELHCALGVSQLARIDDVLARREALAAEYDRRLSRAVSLRLPALELPGGRISWFGYVVRLADTFGRDARDHVVREMARAGIECGRYFAPIHRQPLFRDRPRYRGLRVPVTEQAADRAVALPFFHRLTTSDVDTVCGTLTDVVGRLSGASR